jgi:hypothetical protein
VILFAALLLLLQTANPPAPEVKVDRNAFTFTAYRLHATVTPEKHALDVEGAVTLRNDSSQPQVTAALQISSTLQWRSVTTGGKEVKRADAQVTSDVDHTGAVNETVVSLPSVAPGASVTLHVVYAGAVPLGSNRLRRLGAPANIAERTDFDRIGSDITMLRGAGFVLWYPVSIEPSTMDSGNTTFERLAEWNARSQESSMELQLKVSGAEALQVVSSAGQTSNEQGTLLTWKRFGIYPPVLGLGDYEQFSTKNGSVIALVGSVAADQYAKVFGAITPAGFENAKPRYPVKLVQVPESFVPWEGSDLLLSPFAAGQSDAQISVNLTHLAAHAYFHSTRVWLDEGFAHFAQLRSIESVSGRKAALSAMNRRMDALAIADSGSPESAQPMVQAHDEIFYRTKASAVLWMLRDMVGEFAFNQAVNEYVPERDREPSYFQRLVEKYAKKDLEQFFDDWVYRDRGLPEFKIADIYSRQNLAGGYLVTVTIENSGSAGAEVPITVRARTTEAPARLWVPAKSKASVRVSLPLPASEATVNDGSVPEIDPTNNTSAAPSRSTSTSE